jgi:hypothetical protein
LVTNLGSREVAPDAAQKLAKFFEFNALMRLKLRNNGGKEAAVRQIIDCRYMEPFKADRREVIGLGIELDEEGKGLIDWKVAEEE